MKFRSWFSFISEGEALFFIHVLAGLRPVPSCVPRRSMQLIWPCKAAISAPKPLLQYIYILSIYIEIDGRWSLPYSHIPFIFPLQFEREPHKPRRGQSFWKWRTDHLLLNEDFPMSTSFVLQRLFLHLGCRVYKGINLQCSWQERDTRLAAFLWMCCTPSAPSFTLPVILYPFGEWEAAWLNN